MKTKPLPQLCRTPAPLAQLTNLLQSLLQAHGAAFTPAVEQTELGSHVPVEGLGVVDGSEGGSVGGGFEPDPVMVMSAQFWNCSPVTPFQLEVCQVYCRTHWVQVTPAGSWNAYVALLMSGCDFG